jgi:uncharacterized membrane protein YeaQ/YmgE (transglycosylase-associated protein family)
MNVAPLIFGLLSAFLLIGLAVGALSARYRPDKHTTSKLMTGVIGAYAGGLLFGLATLNVEDGLIGAPIAAILGSIAALLLSSHLLD